MALDGIYLNLLAKEFYCLLGGRIDKIYQPAKEELIFSIRTKNNGVKRLLINVCSGNARIHFTTAEIENPKQPPMFCMLMRKHLSSSKIVNIRQDGFERILYFDFDSINEMGDIVSLTLAIELMGRRSNLLLINSQGIIVDSIKRISGETSNQPALPGIIYKIPPKNNKLSLLECDRNSFISQLNKCENVTVSKGLMKIMEGISPVFARECEYKSGCENIAISDMTEKNFSNLWNFISIKREEVKCNKNQYTVLIDNEGNLKDFCFCKIEQFGNLMQTMQFNSPSTLLDYFFFERDSLAKIKQKAQDLFTILSNTIERTKRRVENQKIELQNCAKKEEFRQYGDLIMANIYSMRKGQEFLIAENFYCDGCPKINIFLNKMLSPTENAQKYYKDYRKLATAEKKLSELISQGEEEIKYLDTVFDALTRAKTEGDIAELREELAQEGYVKHSKQKGKSPKALAPMRFKSSDGYEIKVGRNNKQNDFLTCKEAEKQDIWLHVKDITGCHVIICQPKNTDVDKNSYNMPPDRTIEEAAVIAAYFSKGKDSSRVDVDYTYIKNVKKPNGAKPGMVIFSNNYTITVKPQQEIVENLKIN